MLVNSINIPLTYLITPIECFIVPIAYLCLQNIRVENPVSSPYSMKLLFNPLPSNITTFNLYTMESNLRSLTVSESDDYRARIVLKGKWLHNWGFTKGDKVLVTCTDTGDILIKFDKPGTTLSAMKRQFGEQPEAYFGSQIKELSPAIALARRRQLEKAHEAMHRKVYARVAKRRRH
jgi:hypothetical protein